MIDPKDVILIFDYGHGSNCPGKCSPDKQFEEWISNRVIGRKAATKARLRGFVVQEVWPHDHEPLSIPKVKCNSGQINAALNWRWKRVNEICSSVKPKNCLLISFHSNAAASDGQWHNARGFLAFVGLKASQKSKDLAASIYDAAVSRGLKGNRAVGPNKFSQQALAMCDRTACPAVLIEALFYDNREDLKILQSDEGQNIIADAVVDGICNYLKF